MRPPSTRAAILDLEINGHEPRGVLVDARVEVAQEYYAGVVWDGLRKQPVMLFSRHGRHRHRGGRRAAPRPRRPRALLQRPPALRLPGQAGHRRGRRHRFGPQPPDARSDEAGEALRGARHDAGRDQSAREARGRLVRAVDAHMEMENEARPRQKKLLDGPRRRRRGDTRGPRGHAVRDRRRGGRRHGPPRRGGQRDRVRRQPRPGDRRRRRLAHALRRRAQVRRRAGQLLRDRRQPQRRARPAGWPSSSCPSRAWTRSR